MVTERQDIDRAHSITWASGPAVGALVYPAVLASLPAYRAGLRGIGFAEGDGLSRLVIKLLDELACTCGTHLLRLLAPDALSRIVERLANVTCRAWEGLDNLPRGFVAQVTDAPLGLIEHAVLAPLQPLVAARMLRAGRLGLLQAGQLFIAVLDGGLGRAPTDENDVLPVGRSDQGIHAQVYANDGLLRAWPIGHLANQTHRAIGEARLHEPSGQRDGLGQANAQRPAHTMRQHQLAIADTRVLVGVDHIPIAPQLPRIARLRLAVLAQGAARIHRLTELADESVGRIAPTGQDSAPWPRAASAPCWATSS